MTKKELWNLCKKERWEVKKCAICYESYFEIMLIESNEYQKSYHICEKCFVGENNET